MYTQDCETDELMPPHLPTDDGKAQAIAESLLAEGWQGRALLGWWDPVTAQVFLFTGSHRYAAAVHVEMQMIPVALVEVAEGRLESRGDDLLLDGQRISDFSALLPMLREEDPEAAALLALDC